MSGKGTILIVEDQEGFRNIYEDLLTNDGYRVLLAEDGKAGWEKARGERPDLILLDLGLPIMDGFEVLRRLKADPGTNSIPVLIFSVMGEQKDIKRAMEMGANDYTVKGFYTPKQILSKIKSLMSQVEVKKDSHSYKVPVRERGMDVPQLGRDLGLGEDLQCPACGGDLVLELFPDFVREGGHWFSGKMACQKCGKAV